MSVAGYGTSQSGICGVKTRDGKTCTQPGIAPSGRCRHHGGKMHLEGTTETASYRGRSTKGWESVLGGDIFGMFERVITDPELMNLSSEIAVVTAHLQKQFQNMTEHGETRERWLDARRTFNEAMLARRRKQSGAYAASLERLSEIFREQEIYQRSADDVLKSFRTLERLIAREHKRRIDLHSVMTTEQAVTMLARMMNLVTDHVKDEESLKSLHKGFREILIGAPHLAQGMANIAANREWHGDPNVLTQDDLIDVAHEGFVRPIEAELVDNG